MNLCMKILTCLLLNCDLFGFAIKHPGRHENRTNGEMWPWPQYRETFPEYYIFKREEFYYDFNLLEDCWVTKHLMDTFVDITDTMKQFIQKYKPEDAVDSTNDTLLSLSFQLGPGVGSLKCPENVPAHMNESYTINITTADAVIEVYSVWGLMRALVSFGQLFYLEEQTYEIRVNRTYIKDFPRYPHRGFMLDTSRHYISIYTISDIILSLSYNKLNVLHWHIVDDSSFPYRSEMFPELSTMGAFHKIATYSKKDVEYVMDQGMIRGVRVIPEFNVPGHTKSWGLAFPDLLTMCNGSHRGPLNFLHPSAGKFLDIFFTEARSLFEDRYFHIGGSGVDLDCWTKNPAYQKYMQENNLASGQQLLEVFIEQVIDILKINKSEGRHIVWEDVVAGGMKLPKHTLVQVYKPDSLNDILSKGYNVIYSTCFQYDSSQVEESIFSDYYNCDFEEEVKDKALLKHLFGGEMIVWSDRLDETNIINKIYPRTMAFAELVWSKRSTLPPGLPYGRAYEQTCRMKTLGLNALPIYAGHCFLY